MRVALVYDLRDDYRALGLSEEAVAEFDSIETIDQLAAALEALHCEVVRVGRGQMLAARFVAGERYDLVFSIAEGVKGRSREAQVPALCELFDQPYLFSDPLTMAASLDKTVAKRLVRDAGVKTPAFAVADGATNELSDWADFPAFVKPVAEGTGKGVTAASKIHKHSELVKVCRHLLMKYNQPVLVETFMPGREFTVGIVGSGKDAWAIGALEVTLNEDAETDVYSYLNKEKCEELVKYVLVDDAAARKACKVALKAWRGLGCLDAGRVDLRADRHGNPNFIEVNPLAGLHPKHSDLPILCAQVGISYRGLIGMIMESALKRIDRSKFKARSKKSSAEKSRAYK